MSEDRRLAAIVFTDIVGYTALMGKDEDRAFQILRKNRNIQKPIIKKYNGKWLKEMGDGILASFQTASDAVKFV
jgi:class 3 adenylate cyclase